MTLFRNKYRVESTRLQTWDYTANGKYFVTIVTANRKHFFGNVRNGKMQQSAIGHIAHRFWADIPNHHHGIFLDAFVIMPNHIHGIIVIDRFTVPPIPVMETQNVETQNDLKTQNNAVVETRNFASLPNVASPSSPSPSTDRSNQFAPLKSGSLQAIVHSYKSAVTRWCRKNGYQDFAWQPRFHDHIIRDEQSLLRIQNYIANNPVKWTRDRHHSPNLNQ